MKRAQGIQKVTAEIKSEKERKRKENRRKERGGSEEKEEVEGDFWYTLYLFILK